MTRFLFWNYRYQGPDREQLLARLVHHEAVDIVVLAESSADRIKLQRLLSSRGRPYFPLRIPHELIQVYSGYPPGSSSEWIKDEGRLCLRSLAIPGHLEILLGAVHLMSGLHSERAERKSEAAPLARAIRAAQRERGHARVVVVGDFNLNPFDDGMIFTEGFAAMMTKSLVKKYARSHGDPYARLYNPLWSHMGREAEEAAPGTYYWRSRRQSNTYWNYPDQVLVGHDLLDHFPEHRLRIVTSIPGEGGHRSLVRETAGHWKIDVSDQPTFAL